LKFAITNLQFFPLFHVKLPGARTPRLAMMPSMSSNPLRLLTSRLELISATPEMLQADLEGRNELAKAIDAVVPDAWPPVNWERGPIEYLMGWMQKCPDAQGWFAWYCTLLPSPFGSGAGGEGLVRRTGFQPVKSPKSGKSGSCEKKTRQVGNLSYNTLIGGLGFLGPPNASGETIVGYSLLADFHRQGYCPEAVSAIIDWAFSHSELNSLVIRTSPLHRPSIRVAEKLGFQYLCPGPNQDIVDYSLDRADWLKMPE
jgi:RimJ/RimL family protein N-acetyltransferase